MSKKTLFSILALVSLSAAGLMFQIGSTNSHLTELKDLFFVPLPLAVVFGILAAKSA